MNPRDGVDNVESRKFLILRGLEPGPHSTVLSCYSDYVIPAHEVWLECEILK
jgi:hypothetical protein